MKNTLFFTILCIFLPCFAAEQQPIIDYNDQMRLETNLGRKLKEALFSGKNNSFCKSKDPFCPSLCNHSSEVAYSYYENKPVSWSGIKQISFKSEQELTKWAFSRKKDTYLLVYKSDCAPCAKMLAACETRVNALQKEGVDFYKIYLPDHRKILSNGGIWDVEGTPTLWFFSENEKKEIKGKDFYKTIIHLRKENIVDVAKSKNSDKLLNFYQKMRPFFSSKNVSSDGLGCFDHDEKLATSVVAGVLSCAAYKSYFKLKQMYQNRSDKNNNF